MAYGSHVAKISHILSDPNKKRKTMLDAIIKDSTIMNLKSVQIFVQGPRNSKMSNINYNNIKEYCNSKKINLYVHSSYITVGIFSITPNNKNEEKNKKAIENLISQFEACDKLNSKGFVIHLTKRKPSEIINTLNIIIPIIKKFKTPLVFEQPAKKPDGLKTYETSDKINNLTKMIIDEFPDYKNWYWCIDTCHLWSAGIKMNDKKIVDKWLCDIKHKNKIGLFHLNGGSLDIFNTGKDKHIVPFSDDDDIWGDVFTKSKVKKIYDSEKNTYIERIIKKKGYYVEKYKESSLYSINNFCKKNNIDSILEINRGLINDIKFTFDILLKL